MDGRAGGARRHEEAVHAAQRAARGARLAAARDRSGLPAARVPLPHPGLVGDARRGADGPLLDRPRRAAAAALLPRRDAPAAPAAGARGARRDDAPPRAHNALPRACCRRCSRTRRASFVSSRRRRCPCPTSRRPSSTAIVLDRSNKEWIANCGTRPPTSTRSTSASPLGVPSFAAGSTSSCCASSGASTPRSSARRRCASPTSRSPAESRSCAARQPLAHVHPDAHACRLKISLAVRGTPHGDLVATKPGRSAASTPSVKGASRPFG